MSSAQYQFAFFLVVLFACAIVGASCCLSGCSGAEFTQIDGTHLRNDAGDLTAPLDAESTIDVAVDAAMNIPEASPVESSMGTEAATERDAGHEDAATCDLAACPTRCPGSNTACCTSAGACGCTDFGPACI